MHQPSAGIHQLGGCGAPRALAVTRRHDFALRATTATPGSGADEEAEAVARLERELDAAIASEDFAAAARLRDRLRRAPSRRHRRHPCRVPV